MEQSVFCYGIWYRSVGTKIQAILTRAKLANNLIRNWHITLAFVTKLVQKKRITGVGILINLLVYKLNSSPRPPAIASDPWKEKKNWLDIPRDRKGIQKVFPLKKTIVTRGTNLKYYNILSLQRVSVIDFVLSVDLNDYTFIYSYSFFKDGLHWSETIQWKLVIF